MNIGLIDVDGHNFHNFALMRASAYHKSKGDNVEWITLFHEYDKVIASKIFTFSPDFDYLMVKSFDFADFSPRKGFKCKSYINN